MVIDQLKQIGDFQKNYQNILLKSKFCDIETLQQLADDIFLIQAICDLIKKHTIEKKEFIDILVDTNNGVGKELWDWSTKIDNIVDNDQKSKLQRLLKENSINSEDAGFILKELRSNTGIEKLKLDNRHEMYGYCICIPPIYCDNDAISFANKYNLQLISSNKTLYRFKTEQLTLLQIKYNEYKKLLDEHDRNIVNKYVNELRLISSHLYDIGVILSELDIASSFANVSLDRNYARPQFISNNGNNKYEYLEILKGRHPSLEYLSNDISFQPNDCIMSKETKNLLYLITGANMSGKSTYLRQIALLIIMAQSGLYVPCEKMVLSLFDAIFVRFGSNDALFKDQSTFMIEMNETAQILKYSTAKSLIIMDEVAKSTSPIEGYCIAKSIIKYIHNNIGCRCLFSTHFYKCVKLEKKLENLKCYYLVTNENGEQIQFTHKLKEGISNHSHALYIAKIAGIPKGILKDASKTFHKTNCKNAVSNKM